MLAGRIAVVLTLTNSFLRSCSVMV